MIKTISGMDQKVRISWSVSALLYLILILSITLEHWVIDPPSVDSPLLIWFLRVLPLLIFLPAIIKAYARGFAWLGFVVLFYFTSGVVDGMTKSEWMGWLQAGLSIGLFSSSIFYVRWFYQRT
ncbi:DUF2069 domain-containing protein [Sansalvadorimonas sp. 2012CJ34-2]|uniref:DUF2069 domain-containing protein n=1 Tax=Parendozoicomonas callyspongiae TaxID=2942213 RepID=A0ABT0PH28_9GAMM|nr:DUF2069 domain-containing protein [Sansalvadorimonas sp. 2012CJ34-2]MCL6270675.1 DUF2069 domain-containing protein [Sansalvadorimonas sp. 2012CJ34-2]